VPITDHFMEIEEVVIGDEPSYEIATATDVSDKVPSVRSVLESAGIPMVGCIEGDDVTDGELLQLSDDARQNTEGMSMDVDRSCAHDCRCVMYNNAMFGDLGMAAQYWRDRWNILATLRKLPKRPSAMIDSHVSRCLSDPVFAKSRATRSDTPLTALTLTELECYGEELNMGDQLVDILRDRLIIGEHIPDDVLVMNSCWSMLMRPRSTSELMIRLEGNLPKDIFKNKSCVWLDDVYRHGSSESTNGAPNNRQACRRTVSIAEGPSYDVTDPVDSYEACRAVTKMRVYTCREMPVEKWMCRPATNEEYGAVMEIWRMAWPYLTKQSRMFPPTAWQYCVYQHLLGKKMGLHRDNFDRKHLKDLSELGVNSDNYKFGEGSTWDGVQNSQMTGSCVIVYTMGNCPMKMVFSALSANGGAYRSKQYYEVCPTFCMRLERGWICVLDSIDDLLMMHGVIFEGVLEREDASKLVRVAMVIRRLDTIGEFYTDTSTLRLSGVNLRNLKRAKGWLPTEVNRNVNT
jgi:hypothetical protein